MFSPENNKIDRLIQIPFLFKVSYFPEHDIELAFDVTLDSQDILAINKVRYHISRLLTRYPDIPIIYRGDFWTINLVFRAPFE